MTTITTNSTGITLSTATYTNPVVITPGVKIVGSGIYAATSTWTIDNAGHVVGASDGIKLLGGSGDLVDNISVGTIQGGAVGVYIQDSGAAITNANLIAATGAASLGIDLADGGSVGNSGAINAGGVGIAITGAAGTVTNSGVIVGTNSVGVSLALGGSVSNSATGTIAGGSYGVEILGAAGLVTNGGIIDAGSSTATAVQLAAGYTDGLTVDPGASFLGLVNGGNTLGASSISILDLASGASAGTLTGLGTQITNFGSIVFGTGSTWDISGNTTGLGGTITGFTLGDTIELTGVTATGSSFSGGVLTIEEAVGQATLAFTGKFVLPLFDVQNVTGGVDVSIKCFASGTRIRTPDGDVRVEDLKPGDHVEVISGTAEPVVWVGRRTVNCERHPQPQQVWPVRVSAGAFGPGMPQRDLYLSPDHAVYLDDVLVPVKHLINGATITQVPTAEVTWFHVELPSHSVLLAEGLPAESYLDVNDRSNFENGGGAMRLFADFSTPALNLAAVWEGKGCAPLVVAGPQLAALREQVNRMAAEVAAAA